MEVKEYIGLDVGKARTGFARGSDAARLAEALQTVPTAEAPAKLKELILGGAAGVVVGLPRGLEGQETDQTTWVRDWVDQAKKTIDTAFYWQDEALTTKLAEAKSKKIDVDALAAQIILQDFLDTPEEARIVA